MLQTLIKTVSESRVYSLDFAPNLDTANGEVVASVTSVAYTPNDGSLTMSGPAVPAGTMAQQRILGGTADKKYEVIYTVVTSFGNILVGQGFLQVEEDAG